MSSSSSESQNSQNDSEYNFIPGNVFEAEEGASEVVDTADDICRAENYKLCFSALCFRL